jgi:hypothetical protein
MALDRAPFVMTTLQRTMGTAASAARPRPSTLSRPTVPPYRRQRSLSPSPPPLDDGYDGGVCSAECVCQHRSTGCTMSLCLPLYRTLRFVNHLCITVLTMLLQAQMQLNLWRQQTHRRLQHLLARNSVRAAASRQQKQRMTLKRCCAVLRRQRLAPLQPWPRHTWPAWWALAFVTVLSFAFDWGNLPQIRQGNRSGKGPDVTSCPNAHTSGGSNFSAMSDVS